MKVNIRLAIIVSALSTVFFLSGCGTTPIFTATPVVSNGATNYTYSISPGVSNALENAKQVVNNIPDLPIPYEDAAKTAAVVLLTATSGVLGLIARLKSNAATTHAKAADLLAATVVKTGQSVAALQAAGNSSAFATVAQHIDNNTTR